MEWQKAVKFSVKESFGKIKKKKQNINAIFRLNITEKKYLDQRRTDQ